MTVIHLGNNAGTIDPEAAPVSGWLPSLLTGGLSGLLRGPEVETVFHANIEALSAALEEKRPGQVMIRMSEPEPEKTSRNVPIEVTFMDRDGGIHDFEGKSTDVPTVLAKIGSIGANITQGRIVISEVNGEFLHEFDLDKVASVELRQGEEQIYQSWLATVRAIPHEISEVMYAYTNYGTRINVNVGCHHFIMTFKGEHSDAIARALTDLGRSDGRFVDSELVWVSDGSRNC